MLIPPATLWFVVRRSPPPGRMSVRTGFVFQFVQSFPEILLPLLHVLQLILQKSPLIFRRYRPGIPSPAITGTPAITITISISTTPATTVTPAIAEASSAHRYIIHISRYAVAGTVSGPPACHRPFSVWTCSISSWHSLILLILVSSFPVRLAPAGRRVSSSPSFNHSPSERTFVRAGIIQSRLRRPSIRLAATQEPVSSGKAFNHSNIPLQI